MTPKLTLYSRQDCCLCDEMKAAIKEVAATICLDIDEIDIDGSAELQEKFGSEVPVLFINGRKAFKYRASVAELTRKLNQKRRRFFTRLAHAIGKETS
ncbi:MAG: glutaredoxin family protein [Candidatus Binatia bacterium]